MHRLEERITEWRKAMTTHRGIGRETLEELENHLREIIDDHLRRGLSESEAFQKAVAQVGQPPAISSEFGKVTQSMWWPVKVAVGLGLVTALAIAMLMISRLDGTGIKILLGAHVFTVTLGYLSVFLIGGVGICFVCQRCFSDFSPARLESLSRSSFMFGVSAAVLSAIGLGLGMIWAKIEWGRLWGWDVKEAGALCVVAWLLFFVAAQRSGKLTGRGVMLLAILGNVIVSLGWFGANMVSTQSYGAPGVLVLALGMGMNLVFLLVGLAPPGWLRLRKV